MTEKEIKFISLLRSLDADKLDRFIQILEMIAAEESDGTDCPKE